MKRLNYIKICVERAEGLCQLVDIKTNPLENNLKHIKQAIMLILVCSNLADSLPDDQKKHFGNIFRQLRNRIAHGDIALVCLYQQNDLYGVVKFVQEELKSLNKCVKHLENNEEQSEDINIQPSKSSIKVTEVQQYQMLQHYYGQLSSNNNSTPTLLLAFNQLQFIEIFNLLADKFSFCKKIYMSLKPNRNILAHFDEHMNFNTFDDILAHLSKINSNTAKKIQILKNKYDSEISTVISNCQVNTFLTTDEDVDSAAAARQNEFNRIRQDFIKFLQSLDNQSDTFDSISHILSSTNIEQSKNLKILTNKKHDVQFEKIVKKNKSSLPKIKKEIYKIKQKHQELFIDKAKDILHGGKLIDEHPDLFPMCFSRLGGQKTYDMIIAKYAKKSIFTIIYLFAKEITTKEYIRDLKRQGFNPSFNHIGHLISNAEAIAPRINISKSAIMTKLMVLLECNNYQEFLNIYWADFEKYFNNRSILPRLSDHFFQALFEMYPDFFNNRQSTSQTTLFFSLFKDNEPLMLWLIQQDFFNLKQHVQNNPEINILHILCAISSYDTFKLAFDNLAFRKAVLNSPGVDGVQPLQYLFVRSNNNHDNKYLAHKIRHILQYPEIDLLSTFTYNNNEHNLLSYACLGRNKTLVNLIVDALIKNKGYKKLHQLLLHKFTPSKSTTLFFLQLHIEKAFLEIVDKNSKNIIFKRKEGLFTAVGVNMGPFLNKFVENIKSVKSMGDFDRIVESNRRKLVGDFFCFGDQSMTLLEIINHIKQICSCDFTFENSFRPVNVLIEPEQRDLTIRTKLLEAKMYVLRQRIAEQKQSCKIESEKNDSDPKKIKLYKLVIEKLEKDKQRYVNEINQLTSDNCNSNSMVTSSRHFAA